MIDINKYINNITKRINSLCNVNFNKGDGQMEYEKLKKELKKIITPDSVFVCIGTDKVTFDAFGPLCGSLLKEKDIPCFGTCNDNVNAITMYEKLDMIYNDCNINNKHIIAIDAAITNVDSRVNTLRVQKGTGVKPGAGIGRTFPTVGNNSILMFTLNKQDLNITMENYRKGKGRKEDKSNKRKIYENVNMLVNAIEEVYNNTCKNNIINGGC